MICFHTLNYQKCQSNWVGNFAKLEHHKMLNLANRLVARKAKEIKKKKNNLWLKKETVWTCAVEVETSRGMGRQLQKLMGWLWKVLGRVGKESGVDVGNGLKAKREGKW